MTSVLIRSRWRAIIPDVLVMLVMAVFGVNVVQRIRQVTHKDHRHLWQILYERTGLLLDAAILVLQVSSKYKHLVFCLCRENDYVSFKGVLTLLCFAILHSCPTRSNVHVGVLVFVTYALVQANQLGGSTPTYDVYDSDNYPLVSSTTQELPFERHHGPLAIMQCTKH